MVLINLKPRKMMGFESEGMLLLAEDSDGNLSLMQPDFEIGDGDQIFIFNEDKGRIKHV